MGVDSPLRLLRSLPGARVAVVVQTSAQVDRALGPLATLMDGLPCSIVVIGVVAPARFAVRYVTAAGVAPAPSDWVADPDPCYVARRMLRLLPAHVAARYVVAPGWRSAPLRDALCDGGFDLAIFAAWPWLWPSRRRLCDAARRGGAAIVHPRAIAAMGSVRGDS